MKLDLSFLQLLIGVIFMLNIFVLSLAFAWYSCACKGCGNYATNID